MPFVLGANTATAESTLNITSYITPILKRFSLNLGYSTRRLEEGSGIAWGAMYLCWARAGFFLNFARAFLLAQPLIWAVGALMLCLEGWASTVPF